MTKFMFFHKLFLTKTYMATLSDEQVKIGAMGRRKLNYLNEQCDRNFERAKAALDDLRRTCTRTERDKRLEAENLAAGWESMYHVERNFAAAERRAWKRRRLELVQTVQRLEGEKASLLDQLDTLREERNQLLDCCSDYEKALLAVAPKAE